MPKGQVMKQQDQAGLGPSRADAVIALVSGAMGHLCFFSGFPLIHAIR